MTDPWLDFLKYLLVNRPWPVKSKKKPAKKVRGKVIKK